MKENIVCACIYFERNLWRNELHRITVCVNMISIKNRSKNDVIDDRGSVRVV